MQEFFDRYGLPLGVIAALTIVIAVLPGNATDRQVEAGFGSSDFGADFDGSLDASGDPFAADTGVDASADSTAGGGTGTGGGTATGGGGGGATGGGQQGTGGGQQSQSAVAGVEFGTGPNCDAQGRQIGISGEMPPCVNWVPGSENGGATFRGVTGDQIVVVRYLAQIDPGTRAILQGAQLSDEPAVVKRAFEELFNYNNHHYETYGREVVFVDVEASGPSESVEAMKADALKIASEIKPFAVIDGDPAAGLPNILAEELARRGVLCMCTTSNSSQYYTSVPPLIFSELPTIDEYAAHTAEFIAKKMAGKPAVHAGDPLLANQTRKFGLIYRDGSRGVPDEELQRHDDAMIREFAKFGLTFDRISSYSYSPGRNQADVTTLIASMKSDGITTIIPVWDPLYPILITQEATRQAYFPEWFMVGTGLSDTTAAGRLYDKQQWSNAFGITPLWVTWETVAKSTGAREYRHGNGNSGDGMGVLINIYRARIETLFKGIHMAGPNLTNETFVKGQYAYPPTGGTPGLPLRFNTQQFPTEIKDFAEAYFDATRRGPDERGDTTQPGMVMKANGGQRVTLGKWTSDPPKAFNDPSAIAISDNPPGGGDKNHEQDGHTHPDGGCLSCG